jgi:hypothetical protein
MSTLNLPAEALDANSDLKVLVDKLVGVTPELKESVRTAATHYDSFLTAEKQGNHTGMNDALSKFNKELSAFLDARNKMGKAGEKMEIEILEDKLIELKGVMTAKMKDIRFGGKPTEGTKAVATMPNEPRVSGEKKEEPKEEGKVLTILDSKFREILSSARSGTITSRATGAGFSPFAAASSAAEALSEALQDPEVKKSDHLRDEVIDRFRKFVLACDSLSPGSGFGRVVEDEIKRPRYAIKL